MADEFVIAAGQGKTELVSVLIDLGVNINHQQNDNGHSALTKAVLGEHTDTVELLLKNNADPRSPIYDDGEIFSDMTYYLSQRHSHRFFGSNGMTVTKFGHLLSAIYSQKELLNSPESKHLLLPKIENSISEAKK